MTRTLISAKSTRIFIGDYKLCRKKWRIIAATVTRRLSPTSSCDLK
jgi:hypothetical protein